MRKSLLLSFLAIWSSQVFAAAVTTVRLNPGYDLVVTGTTTGASFEIGSAKPSGDGDTESAPAKVYVPMDGPNAGATDEVNYFTVPGVTALFTPTSSYTINFPLYINSTAAYYLYMAVKNPSSVYKVVASFPTVFNGSTNVNETFSVSTNAICTQTTDCGNFVTQSSFERNYVAYFFLSTTLPAGLPAGNTITPTDYPGGMYFQVNMSNRVIAAAQVTPTISEIRPGDRRVIIKYSLSAGVSNAKAIRVYNHGGTAAAVPANQPIQSYFASGGSLLATEYTYVDAGEITLTNLFNGVTAYYSVLVTDYYKFGTVLSDDLDGTSKSIEELLKANQCFLLTAGFGEDHFVINYFRHFRDTVLANSFFGREFIHFYYELAPKYALLLYKNETLRALVRGAAYVLYFIFNYYLLILAGALISGSGIYLYKKRGKIKI